MRQYKLFLVLLLLVGCSSMGLVEPQSFDERLAYAYATNTAIREASTSALNAHTITSDDMIYVMGVNNQLRLALDAAKDAASGGDVQTAEGRLLMVTKALTALQTYMRSKGVDVKGR